jgi:predicted RND superfamily exporter protein
MIPNLIPIFAVLGVMGYTGIELSITTMMIGSVAIGLAVNNTIHIFAHFPLSLSRTKDVQQSLYETVRNVGRPAISTGFALMMGFLILIFSEFYPNFYFGILSAFTLLVALICDLTITFVLWVFVGKRLLSAQ